MQRGSSCKKLITAACLAALFTFSTLPLAAQDGALSGTVRDSSGAVLGNAALILEGAALQGPPRVLQTDDEGVFRFVPLTAGLYNLRVEQQGFRSVLIEDIEVGVGQDVELDLVLEITADRTVIEDTVVVTGAVTGLEATRSELVSRVAPETIETLPLNGRDFEDLVALVPGVTPLADDLRDRSFSIFGERPSATSYIVDGSDNNDPLDGGSWQRYNQDAILEFEVYTSGYEAEHGRAQGGVVNVVTRSGTDQLRGSAFLFGRDGTVDSSNVDGQDAPALDRRQWGGTLGGRLLRDQAYFFLSAEALDEERGRNINLSTVPAWVIDGLATPQGSEDLNAGPAVDGTAGLFKVDLLPSLAHRLSLTLNRNADDDTGQVPPGIAGALVMPSATQSRESTSTSIALRDTWLTSSNAFLESTARYMSAETLANLDGTDRPEAMLLLFPGNFIQTGAPLGGQRRDLDSLQLRQSWSSRVGEHEVKVGWDLMRTELTGYNLVFNDVEYSAAFLSPNVTDIAGDLFRQLGFQQSAARFFFLPTSDLDLRNDDAGVFVQDQIRRGAWTVDVGLRYDRSSLFGDDDDNFAPRFGLVWDVAEKGRTLVRLNAGVFYDRNALAAAASVPEKGGVFTVNAFDVALPRLGADYTDSLIDIVITSGLAGVFPPENPAYLPFADDLRADPLALYNLLGIAVSDPSLPPVVTADNVQALSGMTAGQVLTLLETTYPGTDWEFFDVPGGSVVGDRVLSFFPRGPLGVTRDISVYSQDRTPRTEAWTLGVDQRLGRHWTVSAAWVHRRTRDLLTRRITNLNDVAPGEPGFAQTVDGGPRQSTVTYDGRIDYDGFVFSLRRAFADRWGLQLSYTYSDARDNLLTGEVGSGFSNNNHPELDWGPSNLSVPHVGVVSGSVELPWDLRLSGNVFWRSGYAFSPRGLTDTDGDGLVDQRDTSVARNSLRVDDFVQLDLRLEKSFQLGEHRFGVLFDVFNVTNEANVAGVNAVAGDGFGVPNSFFAGREVQLGLRYFLGR